MKLEHSFHVNEDIDVAWDVLNDVRKVALCMPGAAVDTVDGDDVTGSCKIKLGPIALTYRGRATFVERDVEAHRMVLDGKGQDGSNGRASVNVVATLTGEGAQTRVDLVTDLKLTGKPAQFGRGVIADVGDRMIGQFAEALALQLGADKNPQEIDSGSADSAAGPAPAEPLDLLAVGSLAVARRAAMVALPLACALLLAIGLRRSRRR